MTRPISFSGTMLWAALHKERAELEAMARGRDDVLALLDAVERNDDDVVPHLPSAAREALAASNDPNVKTETLVKLFERDPALAQGLLRMANSAFYRTLVPCASIQDGVVRLGHRGIRQVLLKASVEGVLCRPGSPLAPMVDQVWAHLSRTAPLARRLAPLFDAPPDQAFVLALLHDVGKLILFHRIAGLRRKLRRELQLPPRLFKALLKRLHGPLGGLAALKWGLGEDAAGVIATHHRDPIPEGCDPVSEVVYVADKLDVAELKKQTPNLPEWWQRGGLMWVRHEDVAALLADESSLPTDEFLRAA